MRNGFARQGKPEAIDSRVHGRPHVAVCPVIGGEQSFYLLPQFRIIAASFIEQSCAMFWLALGGTVE
jgi:hypothetical protein